MTAISYEVKQARREFIQQIFEEIKANAYTNGFYRSTFHILTTYKVDIYFLNMLLSKEDRQLISLLNSQESEYVLELIRRIDNSYMILSELELSHDESKRVHKLQEYKSLELLEKELLNILKISSKNNLRKAKRERKKIYKNFE